MFGKILDTPLSNFTGFDKSLYARTYVRQKIGDRRKIFYN